MALYDYLGSTRAIIVDGTIRAIRKGRVELTDAEAAKVPGVLLARVPTQAAVQAVQAPEPVPIPAPVVAPVASPTLDPLPSPVPTAPRVSRADEIAQALRAKTVPQVLAYLDTLKAEELPLALKAEETGLNRSSVVKLINARMDT